MAGLTTGAYLRLRRLADDGGRFMLADLRGAAPALLDELLIGLAPFTTGVVMDVDHDQASWRRYGSPHTGRLDACGDAADVALAVATAADGILGPAAPPEMPRFGTDGAADIGLDGPGGHGWIRMTTDPAAIGGDGIAGFLAPPSFWREALDDLDPSARRRLIADVLVPRFQTLNAVACDLPPAAWVES
jgi:hypothetical protein